METDNHEFDLSNFLIESLSLHDSISPCTKDQYEKAIEDPFEKLMKIDPRELLGYNNFGKPREVPESTIGTPIQEFYRGLNVFITGGSGFVGKILIEKLIRSVPHLGRIYVLVRAKKGVSARERINKFLEDEVFLRMKTEVPDYQSKLTFIEGDISEPELGLSEADRQTLHNQVHIVFHSAADVRFVNSLRAAVTTNIVGSKRVIDLAKGMKNLKSYVHVSTAFSNCVRRVVEEKVYKLGVTYQDILKLLREKSDEEIEKEEDRILEGWPNTYTFSKAICEDMISEEAKGLPICIFRPSIVTQTYREPLRGWTNNIYGPTGLYLAIALGIVHILEVDISQPVYFVPVDFTVNAMIAVAWENATDRINPMPVYNYTSSPRNPITWKRTDVILRGSWEAYPSPQLVWYPSTIYTSNSVVERVAEFFLHRIPGYVLDRLAVATGREPRLTKIYNKLSLLKEKLNYFKYHTWEFEGDNTTNLMNKLSKEDQELFLFDISVMDFNEFLLIDRLGLRSFYLKEKLDTMPDAVKKLSWLKMAHYSLLAVSSLAALKLLVVVAHIIPI